MMFGQDTSRLGTAGGGVATGPRQTLWLLGILAAGLAACGGPDRSPPAAVPLDPATAEFVGGEACGRCHSVEASYWAGSHHDLAMQEASRATVLGDFDNATFTYAGTTSTFFERDGGFYVETDGPDGALAEYPIAYTFGAVPLQQYLIELPGGRLQALSICWDTRSAAEGGQRWFHLYPDEAIDHRDPLHWTGAQQNWNYMCAECHSTNLEKNYRPAEDRYETTWSEIDVSCEACHGPGSVHLAWAEAAARGDTPPEVEHLGLAVRLKDPGRGTWIVSPETGKGLRLAPPVETAEIETCARCHARRGVLSEDYVFGRPIADTHRVALLEEGLYHADGQILDEVYVYGSYRQSKMYQSGVTCSDCHEPHGLGLIFPGDKVCSRCHTAADFESKAHHFHQPGTEGSRCVDCHMPPKSYMVVDPRHDHSLRVPRPDLTLAIGTPNACSDCHDDKSVEWAAEAYERWYGVDRISGPDPRQAIHAGRTRAADAERRLAATLDDPEVAGIVRATAVSLLGPFLSPASAPALERALGDRDPLVRAAAVAQLAALPPEARVERAAPRLEDPVRSVRLEAARVLAGVSGQLLTPRQASALARGVDEYRQAQRINAERPEAQTNLGTLETALGNLEAAEVALRRALAIDPGWVPAYVNLADLYRLRQRDAAGEGILRQGLERAPEAAALHHALGLLLVREGRTFEALEALARAAALAPDEIRYAYVHAVALHSAGRSVEAVAVLQAAHERSPADRGVLQALATIHRDRGAPAEALPWAMKLLALSPQDPGVVQLVAQLRSMLS